MDFIGQKLHRFAWLQYTNKNETEHKNGACTYLKGKGLLIDYLNGCTPIREEIFTIDEDTLVYDSMTEIGNGYWLGPTLTYSMYRKQKQVEIMSYGSSDFEQSFYKELPPVYDDDRLSWKRDGDGYMTVIRNGLFEYRVKVKPDGNAFIKVCYTKGDTYHKNSVTVAEINVFNANNDSILAAIEEWKAGFLAEVEAA